MKDTMTQDTITQISLDELHESPFNPRKTFTAIDELAASIKAEGRVLSPLLVRPIVPPLFNAGVDTQPEAVAGFEIVFGHRRFRAAAEAGLASVPCMVRAMTDAEARSAQIAENLSRTDVHPIEEAEGFQAMIDNDGISADELATVVGKSRSYVYGRLKLLQAVPTVRDACLRGEIGSEVALLVARVGPTKLQEKALHRIKAVGATMGDGGQASFRRIKAELAENFTLELRGAMFDREDATLLVDAGVCSTCPKRSGNSPLFEDLAAEGHSRWAGKGMHKDNGEPNRCTDPDCWEAKTKAHLARKAAALEADGKAVVTGNKARQGVGADGTVKGDFVALDKVKAALKKAGVKPQVQHIVNPRDGKVVQAVLHADLVAAGLAKAEPKGKQAPQRETWQEQQRRAEIEREKQRQQAEAETARRRTLLQAVRAAAVGRERTEHELRLVTASCLAAVPWNDHGTLEWLYDTGIDKLRKRVDTMTAAELTTLLLDCAIVDGVNAHRGGKCGPLLNLAGHYGIDAKAILAQASAPEPASTPSTAGAGAKKAGAGAKVAKGKAVGRVVAYCDAHTGQTWSGKGLQPAWLKAALAQGKTLADFLAKPKAKAEDKKVKIDAGDAGEGAAATEDLFNAEVAHA